MGDPTDDRRPPISGGTRLAAVIGAPVRHSLSPTLLNTAFAEAGLDWHFMALEVAEGQAGEALDAVRALGLVGLSVTMPHKAAVAAAVDHRTDEAEALDAVNCVVVEEDRLVGHNTDGDGFLDGLRHDAGLDPTGRRTVVLGAGGAARAVVLALARAGAEIAGLDHDADLLALARVKAEESSLSIDWVEGDMAEFDLGRRFAQIYVPYRTFQHLLTPADQIRALHCMADHLVDGGQGSRRGPLGERWIQFEAPAQMLPDRSQGEDHLDDPD